jgi:putative transposase
MDEYESLSHTKWECKYHVVFIPKCRRKTLCAELRRHLGEVFRKLALQKESRIEEGHLMPERGGICQWAPSDGWLELKVA